MFIHPLTVIRRQYGLSIADLAELSGVSEGTILRIENGSERRVNYSTAEMIADSLYLAIPTLFDPAYLTNIGRPAGTGRPLNKDPYAKTGIFCWDCFARQPVILPGDGCFVCGGKDFAEWPVD